MGLEKPILIGHSMGGRNSMLLTKQDPSRLRALVIVDVGPELSDRGRAAIAGFVQENQEFDDLEHFVANVRKYDPYRPREHIERTVKYNMLQRADGKFVSKCDSNPRRLGIVRGSGPLENITLEDAGAFHLPVLLVRGERSNILAPDAAERFRDALPHGRVGDRAQLRPQRAWPEHFGLYRRVARVSPGPATGLTAVFGAPPARDESIVPDFRG